MTGTTAPGPLGGIRVVDPTANVAGPFATLVLADQGAEVTEVEPPEGDVARSSGRRRRRPPSHHRRLGAGREDEPPAMNRAIEGSGG